MSLAPLGSAPQVHRFQAVQSTAPLGELATREQRDFLVQGQADPSHLPELRELTKMSADGLVRNSLHHMTPTCLQADLQAAQWEIDESSGLPIVDVVVCGAGPAGLATALHCSQKGARTLVLEGGYVGQAFSDAGAHSIHSMRTSTLTSSLVRTGRPWEEREHPLGLPEHLDQIRPLAVQGREQLAQAQGVPLQGFPQGADDPTDLAIPAARAELFEHLQEMGRYLAVDCPNSRLLEQAQVDFIESGLPLGPPQQEALGGGVHLPLGPPYMLVGTAQGHQVLARQVVLAPGLVGDGGQKARIPQWLQQVAQDHPQLVGQVTQDEHFSQLGQQPVRLLSDRTLGQPDQLAWVRQLPTGAQAAVVGSGESAVKACLELIQQNPQLTVHLLSKYHLEAAQVQVPPENFHPAVLELAPKDAKYQAYSMERYREFGTPITPRSLVELLQAESQGRIVLHELGRPADLESLEISPFPQSVGLTRRDRQQDLGQFQLLVSAAGYQRGPAPWSAGPQLQLLSSGQPQTAADTALPGLAVRGRQLAEALCQNLPQRPLPPQPAPPSRQGIDWTQVEPSFVAGVIEHRGLPAEFVASRLEALQADPGLAHQVEQRLTFTDADPYVLDLALNPDHSTPAQKQVVERARQLVQRLSPPSQDCTEASSYPSA